MTGGKKGVHFFGKGCCKKCAGVKQQRKRRLKKHAKSQDANYFCQKKIVLGHPCIPCARLTRVTIRDEVWERGGGAGGGGRGRYKAQRVKAGFHVITCDLTASASHLRVSAVPRIQITVSKSPFLVRVEKYMYCHTISPGLYISWYKGAAHPLPSHYLLTSLPPPSYLTPACYTVHY
jgi:hypothetical protein